MSEQVTPEDEPRKGGRILRIVSVSENQDDNFKNEMVKEVSEKLNVLHQEISISQFQIAQAQAQAIQAIGWVDRLISIMLEKNLISRDDLKNAVLNEQIPDDIFLEMQNATIEFGEIPPSEPPILI